jgi:hypothetical protein
VVAIGRWNEPAKNKKDGRNKRGKKEIRLRVDLAFYTL